MVEMPEDTERIDKAIAAYMRDVDRGLLRENLQLSHSQRLVKLQRVSQAVEELHQAGESLRHATPHRPTMASDLEQAIPALTGVGVDFILIGNMAAVVYGSIHATYITAVVYARCPSNLQRLAAFLRPLAPHRRGTLPALPFKLDAETLPQELDFALNTSLGELDLLGEVVGGGRYEDLLPHTVMVAAFGVEFRCVDLATLIKLKRAAGQPKDLEILAELQALWEEGQA